MAKAISSEKRAAIVKHMQSGEDKKDIAKWLLVHVRTVTRVWNKYQSTGSYEATPANSGRKPLVSEETMEQVVSKIKEIPDTTLQELIDEFDLGISQSALCKRLIRLGLTFKKRRFIPTVENEKML